LGVRTCEKETIGNKQLLRCHRREGGEGSIYAKTGADREKSKSTEKGKRAVGERRKKTANGPFGQAPGTKLWAFTAREGNAKQQRKRKTAAKA